MKGGRGIEIRKTCRYDRPFKEIFLNDSNKDLLMLLLNTCLPYQVKDLKYLNTELTHGNIKTKGKILDLLLETNVGKINLELNSIIQTHTHARNMAYLCNIYANYILVGEDYTEETNIIQLNLTYGIKNDDEVYQVYKMINKSNRSYVSNFIIYEFNMDKIMEFWYSKDKENIEKYNVKEGSEVK